jgi:hypothetical protein
MASFCKHGNEPLGSMKKAGYFLKICVTKDFSKNVPHHVVSLPLLGIDHLRASQFDENLLRNEGLRLGSSACRGISKLFST